MPTSYTADVHSGKTTSLADYMRDCAKAFMFEYRDDLPFSAPLPPTPTFRARLLERCETKARESLEAIHALEGMSDAECEAQAKAAFDVRVAEAARINARSDEETARLRAMADKIAAWDAPAPLGELRKFMLDQLHVSGLGDKPYRWPSPAEPETGAEWRERERANRKRTHDRDLDDVIKQRGILERETKWLSAVHVALHALSDEEASAEDQRGS